MLPQGPDRAAESSGPSEEDRQGQGRLDEPVGGREAPSADRRLLAPGETILLIDRKNRRYLVDLVPGKEFHSHAGVLPHDEVIGSVEGSRLRSSRGAAFLAFRPTLSDSVLKMPRGAQVIYPKELGAILMLADVFAGARVLEAGVGSGALSMALLRAGAHVVGYELREDFCRRARANVERFLGEAVSERYLTEVRDVYDGIDAEALDRVVLDLPEPWRVVAHACGSLRPGGILVSYTPSISQASRLRETLHDSPFALHETMEILHRGWHVEGLAVRPDHRMVAHTGFLTVSRLTAG